MSILLVYLLLIYELPDLTCRTDSAARLEYLKEGVRPAPPGVLLPATTFWVSHSVEFILKSEIQVFLVELEFLSS